MARLRSKRNEQREEEEMAGEPEEDQKTFDSVKSGRDKEATFK